MSDLAFELTGTGRDWLIDRPVHIAIYVALAVAVRFLLHRMIDRMTKPRAKRDNARVPTPALLKPLREKAQDSMRDSTLRERRRQRAGTIGSVLKSTVSFAVLIWLILQTLAILGINVAPFIASAGIVGVALGFGAQNLVRDFLSGLFMMFEDQYGVGDIIDIGEAVGTVETVGLRVTTVRDKFGTLWYCRNGEISRVGNYSQGYAIALLMLPISYTSDVDLACTVALAAANAAVEEDELSPHILEAPEMLGVDDVSSDAVTLRLTVKVRPNTQWSVQRELHRRILKAFDDEGISAPYPTGRPFGAAVSDAAR
ncbi:mechanosensitive ion channel family protein [Rhodococcus sp. D2-41]|uniref:Mechanosensitive ion channel family protein n=1 Tax=Speluncibacter jeojiensis TaxID=2710754 RepID=A0A9X4M2H8_9ACTN|nr:mechanosensitive ion channel family protein [Rhodococcus sp. D2-41]MDG3008593.1 mechanosensitive ion channel family protein [Rhodococcus sp. D2-41]MDG3013201.1 mechanosensitive ion channel family protein [Corynebacteriales bacterium D3-21]